MKSKEAKQETLEQVRTVSRSRSRRARRALGLLEEHAWLLPQESWLHIGCGSGETLRTAERKHLLRGSSWGVDESLEKIEKAQRIYPHLGGWIKSDPYHIPLPDASAGVVLLLESVDRIRSMLREIRRLAKENAVVLLALPLPVKDTLLQESIEEVSLGHPSWKKKSPEQPSWPTLESLVEMAPEYNLLPFWGAMFYEPSGYSTAAMRLREIEEEGQENLLWMFRDSYRSEVWHEASARWRRRVSVNGAYRHHGFSLYLMLRAI